MNTLWRRLGILAFWICWIGLWVYLHKTSRSRVLLVAEDKVLVVKSWLGEGKWSLPGGGLHRGEDPLMGALREVREETGLELPPDTLRLAEQGTCRSNGLSFQCYYFVGQLDAVQPLRPRPLEIADARWVPLAELSPGNSAGDVRHALGLLDG